MDTPKSEARAQTIALLLSDVDGTLVTKDKILTERTIAAVQMLREAGVKFAITSGRPPRGMQMLIQPLQIVTPIAGFNGGFVVWPDQTLIEQKSLSKPAVEQSIRSIAKYELDLWLFSGNDWYVKNRRGAHVDRESVAVQFEPSIFRDYSDIKGEITKIVGVSDDLERVAECEAKLQKELGNTGSATRSQSYYVDVTHPDANKGAVVTMLAKQFSIDPKSIATIGDGLNDVLMFQKAGLSVAMGNASAQVQHAADYVTDTNEQEGFAQAVERFILPALVPSRL